MILSYLHVEKKIMRKDSAVFLYTRLVVNLRLKTDFVFVLCSLTAVIIVTLSNQNKSTNSRNWSKPSGIRPASRSWHSL